MIIAFKLSLARAPLLIKILILIIYYSERIFYMRTLHYFKIFRMYGLVALLIIAMTSSALAADDASSPESDQQLPDLKTESVELNKDYFIGYLKDTKNIITSPARWDKYDWLTAAIITGIAVGLYTQDQHIQNWVRDNKNDSTQKVADDIKKISTFSIVALAGLGAYGYIAPDAKAKTTFLLSVESFIVTGVFVQTLKYTTGRSRPYTGDPYNTWNGWSTQDEHHSFPSGDPSSAFAIASVVASEYDNWFVPPLVYGLSTLIALERVHNDAHWSSDVFVGSVIGYFTGKAVVASHAKQRSLSFEPFIDGNDKGVMVTYRF
jgi:membrane-associated phospholipid phosphatase